jgi:hypothetical protein
MPVRETNAHPGAWASRSPIALSVQRNDHSQRKWLVLPRAKELVPDLIRDALCNGVRFRTSICSTTSAGSRIYKRKLYEKIYCQRALIELRIKELDYGLDIDRASCTRFFANQFRVLLCAAAYVLLQELRLRAKRTGLAAAQVSRLRERLLKLAVWVERSTCRLVLHLPVLWMRDGRKPCTSRGHGV